MSNNENADQNQAERLKTELYDCVSKIVDEETLKLDATATPQFTNALLELAWSHLGTYSSSVKLAACSVSIQLVQQAAEHYLTISIKIIITDNNTESAVVDVEAFAKHAGRSTVTPADVLMLCRRNDGLNQTLHKYMEHLENEREENS
ncbi:hypothetical protein N7490_004241 [Penicillium lividum]|nr:hypothetical protein N7490_004241 [Penicillium lividum]